jgi:hypothetical protein
MPIFEMLHPFHGCIRTNNLLISHFGAFGAQRSIR